MGKGTFINQKLGKRVSRKVELLKSELAGHGRRKEMHLSPHPPLPKKRISRQTP
ncbi:MAG TPA: hypothetical protein VMO17_01450 [Terriglobia bacterium]|nr:hypothetical protein [Terriglobia bacterium]